MIAIDTPAHVQHSSQFENGVLVVGGTNYDLSRGGVATPVYQVRELPPVQATPQAQAQPQKPLERTPYEAQHAMPEGEPLLTLRFDAGSAVLSKQMVKDLRKLPKNKKFIIAAHADTWEGAPRDIAKERAAATLKILGPKASRAAAFADILPLSALPGDAGLNRRVEIFLQPSGK